MLFYLFILYLLIFRINSDDCILNNFPELKFPKSITLENGYVVMISLDGIYSFYPNLMKIAFSYDFTDEQKVSASLDDGYIYINQAQVSQFIDDEGGKNYVICMIKNILYVLSEYGEFLFFQDLSDRINVENTLALIPYKYDNFNYYFIVGYNNQLTSRLFLFYYNIIFTTEKSGSINFLSNLEYIFDKDGTELEISYRGLSCQVIILNSQKRLLCFEGIGNYVYLIGFIFDPDNGFNLVSYSDVYRDEANKNILYITSSINTDKTIIFVWFTTEYPMARGVLFDLETKQFNQIFYLLECNINAYGINSYFFKETKEFVFSCINNDNTLSMFVVNETIQLNVEKSFGDKSFPDCNNYKSFSIE